MIGTIFETIQGKPVIEMALVMSCSFSSNRFIYLTRSKPYRVSFSLPCTSNCSLKNFHSLISTMHWPRSKTRVSLRYYTEGWILLIVEHPTNKVKPVQQSLALSYSYIRYRNPLQLASQSEIDHQQWQNVDL